MVQPVYATVDDYITYVGVAVPEFSPRVMARASRTIDRALVGAIYDTDTGGLPTDATLAGVLRDATCAQARPMVDALCQDQSAPAPDGRLTIEAFDILYVAGLLPTSVRLTG